jgi:hypothetical protein
LDRTWKASDVIAKVAETVEIKVKEGAQTEDIVEQVIGHSDSRMPDGETLDYLPDLVRILAGQKHDSFVRDNFRKTTFFTLVKTNTLVTAAMQAVLVFFFPALFVSMFFYAAKRVSRDSPQVSQGFRLLADVVWYRRRRRFLWEQGQPFFWRRFGFGLLIALASGYLFAPAGMTASIVGEYVTLNPIPGRSSHPFWFEYFKHATPFVYGLAGFLLYSLSAFLERFRGRDLNHRMVLSLLNRGIIVIILSLVLSGITEGDNITRALIFIAGVFPSTGLQAIAKMSKTTVDRLTEDPSTGFQGLPEIDVWKQRSLGELGISSVHDLAGTDLRFVLECTGINPHVLMRAADRALLLDTFGTQGVKALAKVPIYTASELVLYARGEDAYAERWKGKTPRYHIATKLSTDQTSERKKQVEEALDVKDISFQVTQFESDPKVIFQIDNKLMYGSV